MAGWVHCEVEGYVRVDGITTKVLARADVRLDDGFATPEDEVEIEGEIEVLVNGAWQTVDEACLDCASIDALYTALMNEALENGVEEEEV